jgi:predicted metal-binding membrane protein
VWAAAGLPAYGLASLAGRLAEDHPSDARVAAVAVLALTGIHQFTPLKAVCLRNCRSPFGLFIRYGSYRGPLRDLRVGLHHGAYCLGCCWPLFVVLIAVGVMNLAAMAALAAVVVVEKLWSHGEAFTRLVGVAALGLTVAVIGVPGLTPGLRSEGGMEGPAMGGMETPSVGDTMPPAR